MLSALGYSFQCTKITRFIHSLKIKNIPCSTIGPFNGVRIINELDIYVNRGTEL
jgi:hypothetical protein